MGSQRDQTANSAARKRFIFRAARIDKFLLIFSMVDSRQACISDGRYWR
jgi:hypothetical protein